MVESVTKLLLTAREAARCLSICERTLFTLTKAGRVPVVRVGHAVRYAVADLQAYIQSQRTIGPLAQGSIS